jgi:energy-coupling factor transporter ATP-binding protein EcfA2
MLACISAATLTGAVGQSVSVEVHVSNGLPGFTIVGLPDAAVRESRDRVRAALLSSGLPWPLRRVTVNLAPSGVRKGGAGLDLAVAVGVLVATGQLRPDCTGTLAFCGELGLNGSLRHVPGMIALADATAPLELVVPLCDAREAFLVRGAAVHGVSSLAELAQVLRSRGAWPAIPPAPPAPPAPDIPDLADVRGQAFGRHALEVAAAGRHHLLMVGPPGSGKTMLAERLPGVLPALTPEESLTVTRVHSAAGCLPSDGMLISHPPFRAPHHSASLVALVGGGSWSLRPGEISLATLRVLECLLMDPISVVVMRPQSLGLLAEHPRGGVWEVADLNPSRGGVSPLPHNRRICWVLSAKLLISMLVATEKKVGSASKVTPLAVEKLVNSGTPTRDNLPGALARSPFRKRSKCRSTVTSCCRSKERTTCRSCPSVVVTR